MRIDDFANVVVALVGIGLVAVGTFAIAAPETAAAMFGIPAEATQARAYVLATATRDIAIGCWFLALLGLRVKRELLGASMIVVALIPAGDFINVFSNAGAEPIKPLTLHGVSSIAFIMFGIVFWRMGSRS